MKKDFQKFVLKYLKQLQKKLLLEDYHPLELLPKKMDSLAQSQFHYPYKTITIYYSEDLFNKWKEERYDYVKNILTHEMCHVVTDGLYAKACNTWRSKDELEDEREKLTDHIANIVIKLINH